METLDTSLEPNLQSTAAFTLREQQDAKTNLPENDRIDGDLALMAR